MAACSGGRLGGAIDGAGESSKAAGVSLTNDAGPAELAKVAAVFTAVAGATDGGPAEAVAVAAGGASVAGACFEGGATGGGVVRTGADSFAAGRITSGGGGSAFSADRPLWGALTIGAEAEVIDIAGGTAGGGRDTVGGASPVDGRSWGALPLAPGPAALPAGRRHCRWCRG